MTDQLTIGRLVHYALREGPSAGKCRAALVVHVDTDAPEAAELDVFMDGPNDTGSEFADVPRGAAGAAPLIGWAPVVTKGGSCETPERGKFHWPTYDFVPEGAAHAAERIAAEEQAAADKAAAEAAAASEPSAQITAFLEGTVADVAERVAATDDVELLEAALLADDRKGVGEAIDSRLQELGAH